MPYQLRLIYRRRRNYISDLARVYREVMDYRADIAHFQFHISPLAETAFMKSARRHGVRSVMTAHDVLPHQLKPYDRMLFRTLYNSMDAVIVHAEQNRRTVIDFLGIPEYKVFVVPHGDYMHFDIPDAPTREQALEQMGYAPDNKVVLFFGAVRPDKGLDRLIRAFVEIKRVIPEAKLLTGGPVKGSEADARAYYGGIVQSLGLEDAVDLRFGYVPYDEVPVYFAASSVVALPYVESTQSGVVQIAAATKRAVVASRVGGIPEVVEDGVTGLLVPPDDPEKLAEAVIAYLADSSRADAAGAKGYEKARREYSWDAIAAKTIDVYNSILAR
jgi:glycosyltransferase involved in cell wall biosynthesis